MKTKRWLISIGLMGVSILFAGGVRHASAEDLKIGVVDMQKALQSVQEGKNALAQIQKEFEAKKKQLQTEETAIKKLGEDFRKQSLVMSDEARAKKQQDLQERILKLQENTAKSQAEIQQKQQDQLQPIVSRLRDVVSELAKKKGYSVILEKNENAILFSLDKDDLTSDVISQFNSKKKS